MNMYFSSLQGLKHNLKNKRKHKFYLKIENLGSTRELIFLKVTPYSLKKKNYKFKHHLTPGISIVYSHRI
jgi:hypothetical protein